MSKVYYSDKEFEQILHALSNLTEQIEKIEDPMAKELINDTLQHFDALHREALHRMWQFLKKNHSEISERILSDYTIRHLLALYDLETFNGIETASEPKAFIPIDKVKKLDT